MISPIRAACKAPGKRLDVPRVPKSRRPESQTKQSPVSPAPRISEKGSNSEASGVGSSIFVAL